MVKLEFVFDKEKIMQAGLTESELLQPMREHARKYGITEIEQGVFAKDGENALCAIMMFIPEIVATDRSYIELLEKWTLDVDGEKEDCLEEVRRCMDKYIL